MSLKYTVANVIGSAKNNKRRLQFDLLEGGLAIARVTRKASRYGYVEPMNFKPHSDAAYSRFLSWCDASTPTDVCEVMLACKENS
jgi:hypothetical protein